VLRPSPIFTFHLNSTLNAVDCPGKRAGGKTDGGAPRPPGKVGNAGKGSRKGTAGGTGGKSKKAKSGGKSSGSRDGKGLGGDGDDMGAEDNEGDDTGSSGDDEEDSVPIGTLVSQQLQQQQLMTLNHLNAQGQPQLVMLPVGMNLLQMPGEWIC